MFKTIKKLLGFEAKASINDTLILTVKERVLKEEQTVAVEPVIVTPNKEKANKTTHLTQAELEKLSKQQIIALGNEKFGIDMSIRRKKEDLIEEFMIAQKKA